MAPKANLKGFAAIAAASLLAGGVGVFSPVFAQQPPQERRYVFSAEAKQPIRDLNAAVTAKDFGRFAQLVAAAEAVARSTDEKYVVAKLRLQHAMDTKDAAGQLAAAKAVLASGGADPAETALLRNHLAVKAGEAGDWAAAEAELARLVAANPNDLDSVVNLARTKLELKKDGEAFEYLQRAIALTKSAGKQPDEAWYRKSLEIAHARKDRVSALQLSRDVLAAFPTKANLRNRIIVYRENAAFDAEASLDLLRLARAAQMLEGARGYVALAEALNEAGYPGEAKSALEEGRQLGIVQGNVDAAPLAIASQRVAEDVATLPQFAAAARSHEKGGPAAKAANAYWGYGKYPEAAELYRLALRKGGVDADLVNMRLGMALAHGGNKGEAAAAFKAVGGARAELASLWLAWLGLH